MKALAWSFVHHLLFFIVLGPVAGFIAYFTVQPSDYTLKSVLLAASIASVIFCPLVFIIIKGKELDQYPLLSTISRVIMVLFMAIVLTVMFFNVLYGDSASDQKLIKLLQGYVAVALAFCVLAFFKDLFEKWHKQPSSPNN